MPVANTFGSLNSLYKQTYSGGDKKMHKPKLGSGERFKHLKSMISKRSDVRDPAAVAAAIGRKKYGQKKMSEMAQAGKKRHSKTHNGY